MKIIYFLYNLSYIVLLIMCGILIIFFVYYLAYNLNNLNDIHSVSQIKEQKNHALKRPSLLRNNTRFIIITETARKDKHDNMIAKILTLDDKDMCFECQCYDSLTPEFLSNVTYIVLYIDLHGSANTTSFFLSRKVINMGYCCFL